MKIAFIVTVFPTLSETFILNQITDILNRGHNVEIFAEINFKERKVHPDVNKYHLMERVHYLNIPENKIKRFLKAIFLIITNFYKSPIKMLKSLNVFKYGKNAWSLKLFYLFITFLGKKFDIIHCQYGINGIIGIYLKEIGVSGKVITTFHGYDMSEFICQNGNNVYNLLFHEGDLFLPVSNYWKQKLINLNCESNKIIVHHMGIDLEKFKFMEKAIKQREPIKILTIGRLTEKKGHKYAIKAIGKLIRKHKNILYIIAGDGELRSTLESLTSKLGIKNHVTFLGVVEEDEVLNLYRDADIFLLPSITSDTGDQEGIPIVLIEAHATGLPVVSTFHTGIPEIVINGKSGFLVPEKNVDALAERLDFLVSHPALWEKMGKEGREHIEKYFNIKTQIMLLEKIYRKIIKKV